MTDSKWLDLQRRKAALLAEETKLKVARCQQTEPDTDAVLTLAAIIRRVDGSHNLGAAALAEAILCHPAAARVFPPLGPGSVVAGLPDTSQLAPVPCPKLPPVPVPTHDLTAAAPLLYVLWHHQGARSPVGQPIRRYLGLAQFERLTSEQVAAAAQYGELQPVGAAEPVPWPELPKEPPNDLLVAQCSADYREGHRICWLHARNVLAAMNPNRPQEGQSNG